MVKFERVPKEIASRLSKLGQTFAGEQDVLLAYLFGSRARGNAGPLSDVDIGVLLTASHQDCGIGSERHLALFRLVSSTLATDEIDLVILNTAPVTLRYRVIVEGKVLFCRDDRKRILFEVETAGRYLDTIPLRREYSVRFLKRLLEGRLGERD